MKLRGIEFGPVLGASGVQNFFGEGYRIHSLWGPCGPNFRDMTFVAKTTTLHGREGHMPMKKDGVTPKEWLPKCIKARFRKGVALNSVGLSGPGAEALLQTGRWQDHPEPFFLSFMSVTETAEERLEELRGFVALLKKHDSDFMSSYGLQINLSCPNVKGLETSQLIDEARGMLDCATELKIPLMPKFSLTTTPEQVRLIAKHPSCNAICISNTVPWGRMPESINWHELFGTDVSPLAHLGGGGLSGKPLLPLVIKWVKRARQIDIRIPINAGGGIFHRRDVRKLKNAGADSISLGTVAMLRPWRVGRLVREAHKQFKLEV